MGSRDRTISVAIASYDGAPFIGEQLASIAAQTLLPDELIVSDDGSRDSTCALVADFARSSPFRVRMLRQPRQLGILENFYAAFAACTGASIAYCDQDDVWLPEKLARQAAAIDAGAMLVVHPSRIVDGALKPLGRDEPVNFAHGRLAAPVDAFGVRAFGHQMLFRREVLDAMIALRPIAERLSATGFPGSFDNYITYCASLLGDIAILREPLLLFRRHARATSDAGVAETAAISRGDRARRAIARDLAYAQEFAAIAEEGIAAGLVPAPTAGRTLAALRRQVAALRRMSRSAEGSLAHRLARLPAALPGALAAHGFSNARPLHATATAIAAAIG